jgi:hypothetical protein
MMPDGTPIVVAGHATAAEHGLRAASEIRKAAAKGVLHNSGLVIAPTAERRFNAHHSSFWSGVRGVFP